MFSFMLGILMTGMFQINAFAIDNGKEKEVKEGEVHILVAPDSNSKQESNMDEPVSNVVGEDLELKDGEVGITNTEENVVGEDIEIGKGEMAITSDNGQIKEVSVINEIEDKETVMTWTTLLFYSLLGFGIGLFVGIKLKKNK